ncbi:hypothetical protein BDP67DRAFT_260358 [Colletotrichum lupini]|nr:hypothetical protein BDP67DRAFT_260358 [Colletotrichum lupini]
MTRTQAERVMIYTTIPEYGVTSCIEYQYCFNSTFSGIVSTIKCEKHHGANKAESQSPLECRGECSHGATGMELRTDGPGSVGASGLEDSDWSPAQLCLLVIRTITKSTYGYMRSIRKGVGDRAGDSIPAAIPNPDIIKFRVSDSASGLSRLLSVSWCLGVSHPSIVIVDGPCRCDCAACPPPRCSSDKHEAGTPYCDTEADLEREGETPAVLAMIVCDERQGFEEEDWTPSDDTEEARRPPTGKRRELSACLTAHILVGASIWRYRQANSGRAAANQPKSKENGK